MKSLDTKGIEDISALTPLQEGILYHYLKEPRSEVYFEQLSLSLSGRIDRGVFAGAWNVVIETNQMLRTVFRWEKVENPVQIILKTHTLEPQFYCFIGKDAQGIGDEL
jgi:iturin family lipopeptide synthetase B